MTQRDKSAARRANVAGRATLGSAASNAMLGTISDPWGGPCCCGLIRVIE